MCIFACFWHDFDLIVSRVFTLWPVFLLLARYVPNVAKEEYMRSALPLRSMNIDDRPTIDLAFWKISNDHNCKGSFSPPFVYFEGRIFGFSESADRKALLPCGPKCKMEFSSHFENFRCRQLLMEV